VGHKTMTRREMLRTGLGLGVAAALGHAALVQAHSPSGAVPWHDISQEFRNYLIVQYGSLDRGKIGGECKPWVQDVVYRASGQHVWLPQTVPDANGWYWADDPHVGRRDGADIIEIDPGEIVQMQWRFLNGETTPHTFIVWQTYWHGFDWLDSNWVATNTVGTHYCSYETFDAQVIQWTGHYIR